jgi:hypothetical protein
MIKATKASVLCVVCKAVAAAKFSDPQLVTKLLIGQISFKQAWFLFYWRRLNFRDHIAIH